MILAFQLTSSQSISIYIELHLRHRRYLRLLLVILHYLDFLGIVSKEKISMSKEDEVQRDSICLDLSVDPKAISIYTLPRLQLFFTIYNNLVCIDLVISSRVRNYSVMMQIVRRY